MKLQKVLFFISSILLIISNASADYGTEYSVCTESHEQDNPAICGDKIVWQDNRNGNWDIYIYDPINGEMTVCTDSHSQINPEISGEKIVWQDNRNGNWDIYTYDPINGEMTVCTDPYDQINPDISGEKIVWQDNRNGNWDIYIYDPINGEMSVCTESHFQLYPAISGDKVVWQDQRNNPEPGDTGYGIYFNDDIYMYDPINCEKPLCTRMGDQMNPEVSGNVIVWIDYRTPTGNIYMYADKKGETCIEGSEGAFGGVSISGNKIVWLDSSRCIYMYDPINNIIPICTLPNERGVPEISGDQIVWMDYRNGSGYTETNSDIYIYKLKPNSSVPEFPTIALPTATIIGLAFVFMRKKNEE